MAPPVSDSKLQCSKLKHYNFCSGPWLVTHWINCAGRLRGRKVTLLNIPEIGIFTSKTVQQTVFKLFPERYTCAAERERIETWIQYKKTWSCKHQIRRIILKRNNLPNYHCPEYVVGYKAKKEHNGETKNHFGQRFACPSFCFHSASSDQQLTCCQTVHSHCNTEGYHTERQ
jgi:hypothetical protein